MHLDLPKNMSAQEDIYLPNEIILNIMSFLDLKDLIKCSYVCKIWRNLSNTNELWEHQIKWDEIFWLDESIKHKSLPKSNWREALEFLAKLRKPTEIPQDDKNTNNPQITGIYATTNVETNNHVIVAKYKGEFKLGAKDGRGISEWSDGSKYEGTWQNGKRNGFGTYYWSDGRKFIGLHVNDKRTKGKFFWPEGSIYEGEYKNSLRHGLGIFRWPNGDFFEGTWKEGGRYGTGKLTCVTGPDKGVFWQDWNETVFDYNDKGPLTNKISGKRKAVDEPEDPPGDSKRKK